MIDNPVRTELEDKYAYALYRLIQDLRHAQSTFETEAAAQYCIEVLGDEEIRRIAALQPRESNLE